jgi:dUTPase
MEIVKGMDMPTFDKVESLGNDDRGGFGSTGTK